jgi:spermidine synthase
MFQLDMVRCLWAVLPPACLWGASFPLALAGVAARGQDSGRLVGGVYAANTVGAIVGALAFSIFIIPWIGTANAERLLAGLSIVAALVALIPLWWVPRRLTVVLTAVLLISGGLAWPLVALAWWLWFLSWTVAGGAAAALVLFWALRKASAARPAFPEARVWAELLLTAFLLGAGTLAWEARGVQTGQAAFHLLPDFITWAWLESALRSIPWGAIGLPDFITWAWLESALRSIPWGAIGAVAVAALVGLGVLLVAARRQAGVGAAAGLTASIFVAGLLASNVAAVPWEMVAFGRQMAAWPDPLIPGVVGETDVPLADGTPDVYCTYVGEGMNVSVAVTENTSGVRFFHGAGKVQASTAPQDMRLQRMLGHLSALVHKKPKTVLVVACGAGVTAGSFVVHPDVERIVICDIEPLVPTTVTPMFGDANYHIVDGIAQENPRTVDREKIEVFYDGARHHLFEGTKKGTVPKLKVEVVYDDGRHFIRTTKEKFDVITSDPIDPWVKGCAALNTVEYYQMCKEHLNPGGVVSLWIPFYESNLDTAKSVLATFFQVFPNGTVWSNDSAGQGYDAVLLGQVEPTVIDLDEWDQRLGRPDHHDVRESLEGVRFGVQKPSPNVTVIGRGVVIELLATYLGQASHLEEWSQDAQINTDRNLRLQYLAGMWLNSRLATEIVSSILSYYHFPENMFRGSEQRIKLLKAALEAAGRKEPTPVAGKPAGP